jgi:hypothetical protein
MDHETAIKIQAAERYVLDEFTSEERADFEEHFFGCRECADEVRAASILAANTRAVLAEQARRATAKLPSESRSKLWWLWPLAASAALNLVFAGMIVFNRLHPGPPGAGAIEPQFFHSYAVPAASRAALNSFSLPPGSRFFGARFDLLPGQHFEGFECEILDSVGTSRSKQSLKAPEGDASELELAVPVASLAAGDYTLVLRGSQSAGFTEILRAHFSIPR